MGGLRGACAWLVFAVSATGCLGPSGTVCDDGSVCPIEMVCVQSGCASPEQVAACEGKLDDQPCSIPSGIGHCVGGVCVGALCGNGELDPGEACDDGNTASGDGCRADCKKVEMCGDALADDGEACDDGNLNPADRCDACRATTWISSAVLSGNTHALSIGIDNPSGLAVDQAGNLYIADAWLGRVLKVDPSGVVTNVAGPGAYGFTGDGGPATSAYVGNVTSIAVDGVGKIYIADSLRVRRIDTAGIITTFAGGGTALGDGGPATAAKLTHITGLAVDGLGNLYISDEQANRVRRVDTAGIITTFAGTGIGGFSGDGGLATNAQLSVPMDVAAMGGNVYIADRGNTRVRRVDPAGVITTFAGTGQPYNGDLSGDGGPATNARFLYVNKLAASSTGELFVADGFRVRRIDPSGIITAAAGTGNPGFSGDGGPATSAMLNLLGGLAATSDTLYIGEATNHRVRAVKAGIITTAVGTGLPDSADGGAAISAGLASPTDVVVDSSGNVLILDTGGQRLRRVDPAGVVTTIAGVGTVGFSGDNGPATAAQFYYPDAVAVDAAGNIYIADTHNNRIRKIDTSGIITTIAGGGSIYGSPDGLVATSVFLGYPEGVAIDALGNIFYSEMNSVYRIDPAGIITTIAGPPDLSVPEALAVDTLGRVYVADVILNEILRIDTNGVVTRVVGGGASEPPGDGGPAIDTWLSAADDVAVDAQGNLYVTDRDAGRVRRVDTSGIISTVAGSTPGTLLGDGGLAVDATLPEPVGVATGSAGDFYIADTSVRTIRHVTAAGILETIAGRVDPEGMGPLAQAHLADPRALVVTPQVSFIAGGSTGTVQALRAGTSWLGVVAGRYFQSTALAGSARYGNFLFGSVGGVAYDAPSRHLYLTESTSNRIHVVTIVDPSDERTWTIAPLANLAGTAGFADGAAATAKFREPTGLYLDASAHVLYVADTGNHVIRAIDLTTNAVSTVAGTPAMLGFFGDGGAASTALLYQPQAIARCGADLFIADTGNNRIRRVSNGTITTVLGMGVASSQGEGAPARTLPVDRPLGVACDALGNVFASSGTTVRMLPASDAGIVDGFGSVETIYGAPPRDSFPASVTSCLTGVAVVDATTLQVTDACTGVLVQLHRDHE